MQLQLDMTVRRDRRRQLFDDRAVGNAAGRGMIDGLAVAAPARDESACNDRTLSRGVDLAVGTFQRRQHQDPALEIGAVADCRHGDVDPGSGLREGRQVRGDKYRRGIAHQDRGRRDCDAHARQQIRQALRREYGLPLVTCSIEPNHQTVADQLVVAYSFDRYQVLQARTEPAPATRRGNDERRKMRAHFDLHDDQNGSSPKQQPVEEERPFDRVVDYALAVHQNFHSRHAVGRNRIDRAQIVRPDYPADGDHLLLGIDGDLFLALDHQIAVRQNIGDFGCHGCGECASAAGSSLTLELLICWSLRPDWQARRRRSSGRPAKSPTRWRWTCGVLVLPVETAEDLSDTRS